MARNEDLQLNNSYSITALLDSCFSSTKVADIYRFIENTRLLQENLTKLHMQYFAIL